MDSHALPWNPLGDLHASCGGAAEHRDEAVARYSFAIPNAAAIEAIASSSPEGVVELGAGLGYWGRILSDGGVHVTAYDIAPPPSDRNRWYAGRAPWHPVAEGDIASVEAHPNRTLLLVWPTRNETWAAEALDLHHCSGGGAVVVVGEPPGGRTGDDSFHAMLGHLPQCLACRYHSSGSACTCNTPQLWSQVGEVEIPRWQGIDDSLSIYNRSDGPDPERRRRRRIRWASAPRRPDGPRLEVRHVS